MATIACLRSIEIIKKLFDISSTSGREIFTVNLNWLKNFEAVQKLSAKCTKLIFF